MKRCIFPMFFMLPMTPMGMKPRKARKLMMVPMAPKLRKLPKAPKYCKAPMAPNPWKAPMAQKPWKAPKPKKLPVPMMPIPLLPLPIMPPPCARMRKSPASCKAGKPGMFPPKKGKSEKGGMEIMSMFGPAFNQCKKNKFFED